MYRKRHLFNYDGYEPQSGYVLFQEFLKNNAFDTRITVIGNRAFGYRRKNRKNDFRASGSGNIDYNPQLIDQKFIHLAFDISRKLNLQSCAIDGLYDNQNNNVVGEISYTYISQYIYNCIGHWELNGSPYLGSLNWIEGHMWPEEVQIEDFIKRINQRLMP